VPFFWAAASTYLLLSCCADARNHLLGLCQHSTMFFLVMSMLRLHVVIGKMVMYGVKVPSVDHFILTCPAARANHHLMNFSNRRG
jgi:hypothetical protein